MIRILVILSLVCVAIVFAEAAPSIPQLPAISTGMTGNQQFVLALGGLMVSAIIPFLAYRQSVKAMAQSKETHQIVDGRMDEFKRMLAEVEKRKTTEYLALILKASVTDVAERESLAKIALSDDAVAAARRIVVAAEEVAKQKLETDKGPK